MAARTTTAQKRRGVAKESQAPRDDEGAAPTGARSTLRCLGEDLARRSALTGPDIAQVVAIVGDALTGLEGELDARAREIADQRNFIERIVDALPVGLYVVDRESRVQAWNHTRETGLQGVSRGEALGRTIFEILHRQPSESLRREFDAVFATGDLQQFETESNASLGAGRPPRTYRISKIPLRVHGDEVTHVITVGEDVTSWKEAEARVGQSEKLAAIGQLAAGVMHEINNPLATIAACAESMALQLESFAGAPGQASTAPPGRLPVAQHVEYLRVIDAEVRRCKGIVDALLDFSRAHPMERVAIDLNAVVEQTIFLLKHHHRFKLRPIHLDLDRASGLMVYGNAEQLVQVFMALLHNAADAVQERQRADPTPGASRRGADGSMSSTAAGDRGVITVRTHRVAGRVIAEVSDDGAGIPRGVRSKIFEPFFTTKPTGQGTGLGLSVCYGIVADHGGKMDVESEVGVGSTFRVFLPGAAAGAAVGAGLGPVGERTDGRTAA